VVPHFIAGANRPPHSDSLSCWRASRDLWRLITAEMGKPLADSIFEIKKSAWAARHLAETKAEAYLRPQAVSGIPAEIRI